ncbi:MAG TPA: hypothetical protein DEV81_22130 [Cyanobacteria bacterium UBA11049]|nr:hypothetical protein [Cyanobacteria bacterium UBA11049]
MAMLTLQRSRWQNDYAWTVDALVGTAVICLLIYYTQFLTTASGRQQTLILQILGSQSTVALGSFSYSLYLVHAPALRLTQLLANGLNLPPMVQLLAMTMVGVSAAVLLSYCFHLVFERPFMHNHPNKENRSEIR